VIKESVEDLCSIVLVEYLVIEVVMQRGVTPD
jgi:hypothetical protein